MKASSGISQQIVSAAGINQALSHRREAGTPAKWHAEMVPKWREIF